MVATGGQALSEERLRAYFKCSQLFHFGGTNEPDLPNKMAQIAVEYYMSSRLRSPHRDRAYLISKAVLHAAKLCELETKHLVGQQQKLTNQTTLWLDEFHNLFKPEVYYPVTGPLPWRRTVSKTAVDLRISGIFRTAKNQTLHVLSFSPFSDRHSQVNDPVLHLKAEALLEFVKRNPKRPRTMVHMLWVRSNGKLGHDFITSKSLNPHYMDAITKKVQQAERGEHIPLLPCPYQCPYKNKCYLGEQSE